MSESQIGTLTFSATPVTVDLVRQDPGKWGNGVNSNTRRTFWHRTSGPANNRGGQRLFFKAEYQIGAINPGSTANPPEKVVVSCTVDIVRGTVVDDTYIKSVINRLAARISDNTIVDPLLQGTSPI